MIKIVFLIFYNLFGSFATKSILSKLLNPWIQKSGNVHSFSVPDTFGIPDSFDARSEWGDVIITLYDSSGCASIDAIDVIKTVSDRVGIDQGFTSEFSLQDLLFCNPYSNGCNGSTTIDQYWNYVLKPGITLTSCMPYDPSDPTCPDTCYNGAPVFRIFTKSIYNVSGMSDIQTEILTYGPLQVTFDVYEDFLSYTSGVYQHTWGSLVGGATGVVVGWNITADGKTPYWIVEMSVDPDWGMGGVVWILRGANECGIEDEAHCVQFNKRGHDL